MRRTVLLVSVLVLAVAFAPPASADEEPIPVTCMLPGIALGWEITGGTYSYFEVVEAGEEADGLLWRPDSVAPPTEGEWLYHHGDLYSQGVGDRYCRGRYYAIGQWQLYPIPDPGVWPPPVGSEMYVWGEVWAWLNHGSLQGSGFHYRYAGEVIFDVEQNRVWEAEVIWSEGSGQLEGWEFSEDSEMYFPWFQPAFPVLSGYLIPADG